MKLATRRTSGRDGELLVVSRDLSRAVSAAAIAPTLQAALDAWNQTAPKLAALAAELEAGRRRETKSPAGVIIRTDSTRSSMCVYRVAKCPPARVAIQPPRVENSNDCG